jgi:hypothetical protein
MGPERARRTQRVRSIPAALVAARRRVRRRGATYTACSATSGARAAPPPSTHSRPALSYGRPDRPAGPWIYLLQSGQSAPRARYPPDRQHTSCRYPRPAGRRPHTARSDPCRASRPRSSARPFRSLALVHARLPCRTTSRRHEDVPDPARLRLCEVSATLCSLPAMRVSATSTESWYLIYAPAQPCVGGRRSTPPASRAPSSLRTDRPFRAPARAQRSLSSGPDPLRHTRAHRVSGICVWIAAATRAVSHASICALYLPDLRHSYEVHRAFTSICTGSSLRLDHSLGPRPSRRSTSAMIYPLFA